MHDFLCKQKMLVIKTLLMHAMPAFYAVCASLWFLSSSRNLSVISSQFTELFAKHLEFAELFDKHLELLAYSFLNFWLELAELLA